MTGVSDACTFDIQNFFRMAFGLLLRARVLMGFPPRGSVSAIIGAYGLDDSD